MEMILQLDRNKRERGMVTFLTASSLVFLIFPFVGLAIDVGVAYTVKAKLQTAVDGASLAAGRSLSRGLDVASQQSQATDTAKRFFHANFPNGWMGVATVADPTVTFPTAPLKTVIVNIVGTVQAPTYFMRILNWDSLTVSAVGQVTRRDVNVILVLDRSGSLASSGSCGALSTAAKSFVDSFVNGRDKLGMITFGTDYRLDFAPTVDFGTGTPTLSTMLSSLTCYGYTNAAAAFWQGYQQIVTMNDTGSLNVILFFTDGQPNALTFGMYGAIDNRLVKRASTTTSTTGNITAQGTATTYNDGNVSPCVAGAGPFSGVISYIAGIYQPGATGYPATQTLDAQKIGATEGNPASSGCAFDAQFSNTNYIYKNPSNTFAIAGPGFYPVFDVAYLPRQDMFGNYLDSGPNGSGAPFVSVRTYPSGVYSGKIRSDDVWTGCCTIGVNDTITNAGINALDNAAQRARADAATRNLGLVVYAIGLGNAPGGVNNLLLARVANDPDTTNLPANTSYNDGIYVFSPDATQLNQAFNQIASEVLRLSK
jgi:Flp pilus assembly protein TadG